MRVLVLAEAVGDLGAGQLGACVARAWAARGHQVAVVPLAVAGEGVQGAVEDLLGPGAGVVVISVPDQRASSGSYGVALAAALDQGPDQVWLDLAAVSATDAGVGLLKALGGVGVGADLDQAVVARGRVRLGAIRLLGIVREAQVKAELTGLRGVESMAAAAARDAGKPVPPVAELLERDAALAAVAASVGLPKPPPGAGAERGLGLAVLALGGSLASGPAALAHTARLDETLGRADLVVVVADALDFGDAGGEVVTAARKWAEAAAIPCVALCETVRISTRELRQLGIEAAYGLAAGAPTGEQGFAGLAARVASTWTWPAAVAR